MIFVKYYREDFTTGEPSQEVDYAIVPYVDLQSAHEYCVRAARHRPEAQFYQIFEGTHLRNGRTIGLMHELPKVR